MLYIKIITSILILLNIQNCFAFDLEKDLKKGEASKDVTKNLFFTKISHEIAYTEYAMGLVNLLYQKGYYGDATEEYLQEVREIINALSSPHANV